jgi:hypothetical protein
MIAEAETEQPSSSAAVREALVNDAYPGFREDLDVHGLPR